MPSELLMIVMTAVGVFLTGDVRILRDICKRRTGLLPVCRVSVCVCVCVCDDHC